ncbi:MAG: hypothetical protein E6H07_19085 [Bacteroidetes bacterium]|nr:MAG: hypothetical protein E6H07_19085 [Bacteroidota bacterium]
MKSSILLLALATVAFSSCTTAYKTGQTPDDVYYSPARPVDHDEYVRVEDDNDREYRYDEYYYDDRYLRMKVQNRNRWNELDDWYYFDRYRYSYYNSSYWGNPWSPNTYWNNYYNPYSQNYVVVNPKSNYASSRPRTFNLNTYNNNNNLLSNKGYTTSGSGVRTAAGNPKINTGTSSYNNNNSSSRGGVLRDIFSGGSNSSSSGSSNNSSSSPRTSSSSSSSPSSSGSSGGGGGSAPVRKF